MLQCPAGELAMRVEKRAAKNGNTYLGYLFSKVKCRKCPLRERCRVGRGKFQWVIAESKEDGSVPLVKVSENAVLFTGNGSIEFSVELPAGGINAAIADHFEMLLRDMTDEAIYELHNRKSFFSTGVIFVAVIMEGDKAAIILVNPGCGNNRRPQTASNN